MDFLKGIEKAGDDMVATVRTAQDSVAKLAETVGSPIARLVPELPLPEELRPPRPRDVVEFAFRFWEALAQAQKEFTLRLLDALEPGNGATRTRHAKAA